MSRLIVFGAGGHGRVVADAARRSGRWKDIVFADDRFRNMENAERLPVIGAFADALGGQRDYAAALGIGNNARRLEVAETLREKGIPLPAIVHPDATVAEDAAIADAVVVLARAVLQPGARAGFASIINTASVVEHDCVLEEGVHVSPGACLGGEVRVGRGAWIGMGAVVAHLLSIGAGAVVGAGAAVTVDVPGNVTVVGVPAKPLVRA